MKLSSLEKRNVLFILFTRIYFNNLKSSHNKIMNHFYKYMQAILITPNTKRIKIQSFLSRLLQK